jgi:hypothetical protein
VDENEHKLNNNEIKVNDDIPKLNNVFPELKEDKIKMEDEEIKINKDDQDCDMKGEEKETGLLDMFKNISQHDKVETKKPEKIKECRFKDLTSYFNNKN